MTFTAEGLVLGGTILAPANSDPEAAFAAEPRILALLAVAYGKSVRPEVLGNIRRALRYRRQGDSALAAIEIALSGLSPLSDEKQAAARLSLGEQLLAAGLGPRELIKLCGLDPDAFDVLKAGYNPDQPRVPAGNPEGGQWTADGLGSPVGSGEAPAGEVSRVDPNIEFVAYTPVHGLPNDGVVVRTPDGRAIADPDSTTKKLMAPPHANFKAVYAAGHTMASLPLPEQYSEARAAIAQGGRYDFQRDPTTGKFYHDYIHAANYAAGVYMAGAGYSLSVTLLLAKLYALRNSNNYDAQDQLGWIKRGWSDGTAGIWK